MKTDKFAFTLALGLLMTPYASAQDDTLQGKRVYTNNIQDNWELGMGLEGLAFYSSHENELGLSKSPFRSYRSNFGATAHLTKWFTPEIGLREKGSGYWGKAVISDDRNANAIRFYALQAQALINATNIIGGYDPARKWDIIPYGGAGFVRNCTYNDNSISAAAGILTTYRLSPLLKIHYDLGVSFAGDNYNGNEPGALGRYKWLAAELGLTFELGKRYAWSKSTRKAPMRKVAYQNIRSKHTMAVKRVVAEEQTVPQGMVLINRGHLRMGDSLQADTLWGAKVPFRDISVDDFWMDKTEVTNAHYREFVYAVRDSIIRQRMNMPEYQGNPARAIASIYTRHPLTGDFMLDTKQLVYKYEKYDYAAEMKRHNRLDPKERILDTDIAPSDEVVMISKDTAYFDKQGNIIRETINRPLTGPYDFLNTYIVQVYPDTTCWVNDFPNAQNGIYAKYYFAKHEYDNYPVVGVTWEQADAFCDWRTKKQNRFLGNNDEEPFRLPTEAEWEYAARGWTQNEFPWEYKNESNGKTCLFANFMPENGNFTKDGNIITSRVAIYEPNTNGLYDMAGNVAEWTSTAYTNAGVEIMNNINPELNYNAAIEDPYRLKRKCVRGGSWKDPESHIRSAWRQSEYQNQPRSYIGFRCVKSLTTKPSEKSIPAKLKK